MASQVVDTDSIALAAGKLRTTNNNINNAFDALKNKAVQINDWEGEAGSAAQTTLAKILKINDERTKVLQNYINFLEQKVNPGYIDTETVNTTLADMFK